MLAEKVALSIQQDILRKNLEFLPSHYRLAVQYGVATRTVLNALHILEKKGVVRISQGRKTIVIAPGASDGNAGSSAADTLAGLIQDAVASGSYRSGQGLPKLHYFTSTYSISPHTVCAAFEKLHAKKLIHKQGRKWIVGPSPTRASKPAQKRNVFPAQTILIIVRNYSSWQHDTHFSERSLPFIQELIKELKRYDIRFILAQNDNLNNAHEIFPTGEKNLPDIIRTLGQDYAGTLVMGNTVLFPEIPQYIALLEQFGKPVIWFNPSSDIHSGGPSSRHTGYYYCMPDHKQIVKLAIESLTDMGHRRILVPLPRGTTHIDWINERIHVIRNVTAEMNNAVSIHIEPLNEKIWGERVDISEDIMASELSSEMQNLSALNNTAQNQKDVSAYTYSLSSSLDKALETNQCTAILAFNQSIAINIYYWLRKTGALIPRDISMVTIDNLFYFSCFPISTIDWNFEDAGYCAAHIFSGVLPVKTDKNRIIPFNHTFIDRGSIGKPGKRNYQ